MLMQTKSELALAYDISALSLDIQLQILGREPNRSLFSRFPKKLLGIGTNTKTIKGEKYGIKTAILYLMPAMGSGVQMCAMAKIAGCEGPCLFTSGRGAMSNVMLSRLRKTLYFNQYREQFMLQLQNELIRERSKAKRRGYKLIVRLNGTSDIRWENVNIGYAYANIMQALPDIQFYDYTKLANRKHIPANYDLTFSYSGVPAYAPFAAKAVANGERIAVVFRDRAIINAMLANGDTFLGLPVVDGEDTDIRHLDSRGAVVALYAKGKARRDQSGFVVG
ncbi:hypothetical protein [Sphingorhabdus sp.]|uniref:GP88 family protein n=1 Tax=Sphingorhabdus sp. TaxID=1902408 RepID=UPI0033412A1C